MGLLDRLLSRADTRLAPEQERAAVAQRHAQRLARSEQVGRTLLAARHDAHVAGGTPQGAHPVLSLAKARPGWGFAHETQLAVYHALRLYLPTLDSAIHNRRQLEGELVIVSDDEGLADDLNAWAADVPVGYVDAGAHGGPLAGLGDYVDTLASAADEYGLAAGECLLTDDARDLARLVVPCPRTLGLRRVPGAQGRDRDMRHLVQTDGRGQVALQGPTIQALAFEPDAEQPWPRPLAWSLVQAGEVLMRMYQSVVQGWWRFGDPSLLFSLDYRLGEGDFEPELVTVGEGDAAVEVPAALVMLKGAVEEAMTARRNGYAADAYTAAVNAETDVRVLGNVDHTMARFFREHASTFGAYIVERSDTPAWMYPSLERAGDGLGGALSTNQTILAGVAARKRNKKKRRVAKAVLDLLLTVRGDARQVGRYDVEFDVVSIVDDLAYAELRSEQAAAAEGTIANAEALFDEDGRPRFQRDALAYLEDRDVL